MKKRLYLLIPVIVLLALGSLMLPARASSISDPQNDLIGLASWTEDGEAKFDCDWAPAAGSMIDIEKIEWLDAGLNYTVNVTFYGTPNATKLETSETVVYIFFLINGTAFPDDLETETPVAHLTISSLANGTIISSNNSMVFQAMTVGAHSLFWTFPKDIDPTIPVALENWDLVAYAGWGYSVYDSDTGITFQYTVLDHYNYDYLEETLLAICALLDLNIPGYSLIVVGVVATITIGVIIKKKFKK